MSRSRFSKASKRSIGAGVASGFTLVKLLVVIEIIALLIAILLPVPGRARAQAQPQESGASDATPPNLTWLASGGQFAAAATRRVCINRHQMAINAVMCDGSGQHIPLANLHKLAWFRGETLTNFNPPLPSK